MKVGVRMAFFKNKEEKEEDKLKRLDIQMSQYNLKDLSEEDKKEVHSILYGLLGTGMIAISSKPEDAAKIDLLKVLIEQNWMIIKLLNEIKNK